MCKSSFSACRPCSLIAPLSYNDFVLLSSWFSVFGVWSDACNQDANIFDWDQLRSNQPGWGLILKKPPGINVLSRGRVTIKSYLFISFNFSLVKVKTDERWADNESNGCSRHWFCAGVFSETFLLTVLQIGANAKESSCVLLITRVRTIVDEKPVDWVQRTAQSSNRRNTGKKKDKLVSGQDLSAVWFFSSEHVYLMLW